MASQGSVDPDGDSDLDVCDYCRTELHTATDDWLFVDASWGSALTNAHGTFTFCTQAHAAQYFAENNLPEPAPSDPLVTEPTRGSRVWKVGVAILVLLNLAFYVLGLITWLRWVWR
jgi:hypothetical protein